jgi:hypothetical protein
MQFLFFQNGKNQQNQTNEHDIDVIKFTHY